MRLLLPLLLIVPLAAAAQDADFRQEYLLIERAFADLERRVGDGGADRYFLDDRPYSGAAREDHPQRRRYRLGYYRDGYLEKLLTYGYDGIERQQFSFRRGRPHGHHYQYFEDGHVYTHEFYRDGRMEGYQRRYDRRHRLVRERLFRAGLEVYDHHFAEPRLPGGGH